MDKAGGDATIIVDVDDKLLTRKARSIPREDVAEVCIQSLVQPKAKNLSFDVITEAPGSSPTTDFDSLFASLGGKSCAY